MKKFTLLFAAILAVSMSFATTVTKTVESLATELSWTNSTVCTPFALDNAITVSTTATDANTGKYYSNGQQIRLYQTGSATITLTAGEGYSISSVALTYVSQNTGILLDATGAAYESGTDFAVNAQAVTFSVGNSGEATNGQARITAFEVVYNAAGDTTVVPVDTTVVPSDTTVVPIVVIDTTEITCAQARELALALSANNQPTEEWYAVTGFITEVVGNVSRNQQTFWMADTLEGGRVFEGYWANLPESIEAFEVGMQVKMIGHLMKYNTTPEIKNGEVTILAMPVPVDTTSQDTTPVIVPVTMETLTFKAGVWKQDSAKFGAWVWGNSLDGQFTDFFTPLLGGEDTYSGLIPETADSIVFVRFADTVTVPAWGNGIVWNQTINYAVNHADMFFSMNDDWSTGVWGTPVPVIDTTAITCAQARELALALPANNQPTEEWYAVTGYITEVVSNVSRNQQTFWMADSLEGGRVFEGYWANLPDSIEAFEVGMQVTMIGHLMKYNTTPEIKNGEVIILAMPVIPEPVHYYIKNNWNGGDWAWEQMTEMPTYYEYVGVYGGNGVNINTSATDEGAAWFPQDSIIVNVGGELQALDTVMFWYMPEEEKVYAHVVGRPEPAPVVYYIKNNWHGTPVWAWAQMTEANGLYEYTGVWGGIGVNINTVADDDAFQTMIWISAEEFEHDTTFVPQAMDTLYFLFNPADTTLLVDLIGRPAPAPVHYYIKNNWNGAEDWTWEEMTETAEGIYAYTGVWGGQGVNINTRMEDEGSYWAPAESWILVDSTLIPRALDTLLIQFNAARYAVTVEVLGRPVVPEVFQIKNNWNGGEWTWVDMTPVEGEENIYAYTGVFGGTGVNITSNYMNGELWFPVDSFLVNEGELVPQAMDTVLFAYNSVENEVAAMVLGRPAPVVLDTIVAGVHIINETGWAQLNLYMWGEAGELFGAWPGQTLNEDYAVEGVEGSYFAIIGPYAGLEENLIFNDGNGVQFRDLTISLVDTVYEIVVRADGAYFADQVPAEALTIAEATATEVGTELITRGIVTYINNKNAYIQDATAGILLYNAAAAFTNFSVGDEIIVSAKRAVYGNAPELSNVTLDTILSYGNTVTPIEMTLAERVAEPLKNFGMMVSVKNLEIVAFDSYRNASLSDGVDTIACYKMSIDTAVFHVGDMVDVVAIAGYFNKIQFQGDVAGITMHVDDMYYIKNNWNRGADWTWMDMIPADDGNLTWMYTGIFGGTGVNINTAATDENALWFPIDAMIIPEGNEAPEAGDSVMFVYNTVDKTVTATVLSQVIPGEDITVTFFVRDENTIWEDLYVYAWGAAEAFGAWNGYQVNQEENIIVGGEYDYRFTLTGDYEGLTLNLIFNDGIGGGEGHQFADLAIEDMQDGDEYFIIVTDEKAYFEGGEGLEEVVSNAQNETTKVIMNGQLYIIRDGKVYNALGAQVR